MKQLKNTVDSALVTKNGREAFVALSVGSYEVLCAEAARAKRYQAIDRAEADIAVGRLTDARKVSAGLRVKYGP